MKLTNCFVCEKELPQRRTKFCTDTCADFYESTRRKTRTFLKLRSLLKPRICICCGNTFQPKTDRHTACNLVCRGKVVADREKIKRIKAREVAGTCLGEYGRNQKEFRLPKYAPPLKVNIAERLVDTATFTRADTKERVELEAKVKEFLANGGKILKYGAQPAVEDEELVTKWDITEREEELELERYKDYNANNGN
tara:strand:+ start:1177 stop:1764 length:588 start_codon:yes stop_codon:yes gene_type:complete